MESRDVVVSQVALEVQEGELAKAPIEDRPTSINCTCDGVAPWCAVCAVQMAMRLRYEHGDTVSIGMLKRRIPLITGREAAILLEASKRTLDAYGWSSETPAPEPEPKPIERWEPSEEEPKVVLSYSEAEMLKVVRADPGISSVEIARRRGVTRTRVTDLLVKLAKGGHVQRQGRSWCATHNRPIGKVKPYERVGRKR